MCVKINYEELFFNAFPFENSYYFISGRGLDVVRSTGNMSSLVSLNYNFDSCSHE